MPPSKGSLAANKAILSLFLDGPETLGNIRTRLRTEYGDARWSRSIVDYSIPALALQGHIALIASGEKTADSIYEVTNQGVAECKRYMRESPRTLGPRREPLQLWIEHSTEDELPVLLAAIRETEVEVLGELAEARKNVKEERRRGRFRPAGGSNWPGRKRYAVLGGRVLYWQGRVDYCGFLRQVLVGQRELHKRIPADNHV
jgi:hypothetical protein